MPPVVVALDGSAFADAALPVALGVARATGAPLELVSVVDSAPGVHAVSGARVPDQTLDRDQEARLRTALHAHLEQVRGRVSAQPDAPAVSTTLLNGRPAECLLDHAERTQATALVITTHGRGGLSRLWLGSVTDALVRHATCPIVVVRPVERAAGEAANLTPVPLGRLLVTLDGSHASERVLQPLMALFGNRVAYLLMRAVSPLHPLLQRLATGPEYEQDLASQTDLVTRYLNRIVDEVRATGADAAFCAPAGFEPAHAINEAASNHRADLIAIATHGRGPLGRVLLGSVADKVLRSADLPVLLYRTGDGDRG